MEVDSRASALHNVPQLLGSHENGMALVGPPSTNKGIRVVAILQQINKIMQERKTKKRLRQWIEDDKDNSAREIQGGRMEIFLQAEGKKSEAFDRIVGDRLAPGAKQLVLEYAREQATRDPRLQSQQYKFGNFSLIVSFDMVDAQAPHIDLIKPNHQFGLMVSEGATATLFFESNRHLQSVDAVVEQWQNMANVTSVQDPSMPPALIHAMKQEPAVQTLLQCFGDVLFPERYVLFNMKKKTKLPSGSLLSLPGSVVHAAPAAASYRAVIFFSGWPHQNKVAEYNPDTQYTGVMLAGHLTSLLWKKPGVGFAERLFLLQRLAHYIDGSMVKKTWGHFAPGVLADFVGNIEQNKAREEDYIVKVAKLEDMPSNPFGGDDGPQSLEDYQLVSVDDLFTVWDAKEFHVEVHKRIRDGKIIVRYPSQGSQEDDEYEGNEEADNFQLIMNKGYEGALFNGRNGRLLASDGEGIDVYQGRGEDI